MKKTTATIKPCTIPNQSAIYDRLKIVDYWDAYQLENVSTRLTALEIYIHMVNHTPVWINALLSLRNKTMKLIGLKDVGNLGGLTYSNVAESKLSVGDKLDLFNIERLDDNELVLLLNDSHLDIKISILKETQQDKSSIYVSTMVKYNNTLGKIYMRSIMPFHKMVVRRLLACAIRNPI